MSRMVDRIDRALYPRQSTNWDDCMFRDRCITGCRMSNAVYFGDNLDFDEVPTGHERARWQ